MKRIQKSNNSTVILEDLEYPKHSKKIREILSKEQQNFCAYTEHRLSSALAPDIEHFNPTRKQIAKDYFNWYAVGHTWNSKKASKWNDYQPVLHPSDPSLEERVFYHEETGTYKTKPADIEAINLLKLLDINNYELSEERKTHIQNLKKLKENLKEDKDGYRFLSFLREADVINFRRAIETVFNIKI